MIEVPEALRASPHTGSSTQWVPDRFPHQGSNKADALSTELQGHISIAWHVNTPKVDVNRHLSALKPTKRDHPRRAISFAKTLKTRLMPRACVPWFRQTRDDRSAH